RLPVALRPPPRSLLSRCFHVARPCVFSGVLGDCFPGSLNVTAPELDRMYDERGDLVQRHAIRPAVGERMDLLVRLETGRAEAAEQPHHREVELTVSTMRGRVDQPAAPAGVDKPVAGPEVAVQPRSEEHTSELQSL